MYFFQKRRSCTANSCFALWVNKYSKWAQNGLILCIFFLVTIVRLFDSLRISTRWKITHYEKIFSHIKQKFSHFERGWGTCWQRKFFVSLRLPLFSPKYIALKLNQIIITKISNYLTWNTFLTHPENLPLKEIPFNKFKLTHTKAKRPNQWA